MKKKCQVVMLPTEKAIKNVNDIVLSRYNELHLVSKNDSSSYNKTTTQQYLHILSDEEVKEDDWCILNSGKYINIVCKNKHGIIGSVIGSKEFIATHCKKIIATTNPELTINIKVNGHTDGTNYFLPQIPQHFIESYIKEYNDGNPIKEVMIEYEEITNKDFNRNDGVKISNPTYLKRLKLNPDNTIIISLIEDIPLSVTKVRLYTKQEALDIAIKASREGFSYSREGYNFEHGSEEGWKFERDNTIDIESWFNLNYPE